jgi:hypothetical protein
MNRDLLSLLGHETAKWCTGLLRREEDAAAKSSLRTWRLVELPSAYRVFFHRERFVPGMNPKICILSLSAFSSFVIDLQLFLFEKQILCIFIFHF